MQPFNLFDELAGGLQSYAAETSPANQGGLTGFAESILHPEQVLKRQRLSDILAEAHPMMQDIFDSAQAGDLTSTLQKTTSLSAHLLQQTGDPQFVNFVSQSLIKPAADAYYQQQIGKIVSSINPDDPETAKAAIPQLAKMGQIQLATEMSRNVQQQRSDLISQNIAQWHLENDKTMAPLQRRSAELGIQEKQAAVDAQPQERILRDLQIQNATENLKAAPIERRIKEKQLESATENLNAAPIERRIKEEQLKKAQEPTYVPAMDTATGKPAFANKENLGTGQYAPIVKAGRPPVSDRLERAALDKKIFTYNALDNPDNPRSAGERAAWQADIVQQAAKLKMRVLVEPGPKGTMRLYAVPENVEDLLGSPAGKGTGLAGSEGVYDPVTRKLRLFK